MRDPDRAPNSDLSLLERRLRELQDAYYGAPGKDEALILEYLRVLSDARRLERLGAKGPEASPRLHVGCGGHRIEGWINIDVLRDASVDLLADAGALPFADGSVAFVHSEDLLEHLDLERGQAFLAECFRLLRPGGVLRLLTPDLRAIVEGVYLRAEPRHLEWCASQLQASGPCEALNMHLRMNGEHRFLFDEEHLQRVLREIGFGVERVRYNRSAHRELRYLDLRDFGLNLFVEAEKPAA